MADDVVELSEKELLDKMAKRMSEDDAFAEKVAMLIGKELKKRVEDENEESEWAP